MFLKLTFYTFRYASDKAALMNYFNVPRLDVPELIWSGDEMTAWADAWYEVSFATLKYSFFTKKKNSFRLLATNTATAIMRTWATQTYYGKPNWSTELDLTNFRRHCFSPLL